MMPAKLKETTLDPEKRRLLQVSIHDTEKLVTENTISELMGKDSSARYKFIMEHAGDVEELDV
jgi:DNA gyrase subunit B/topoisomerase-4 subunit B